MDERQTIGIPTKKKNIKISHRQVEFEFFCTSDAVRVVASCNSIWMNSITAYTLLISMSILDRVNGEEVKYYYDKQMKVNWKYSCSYVVIGSADVLKFIYKSAQIELTGSASGVFISHPFQMPKIIFDFFWSDHNMESKLLNLSLRIMHELNCSGPTKCRLKPTKYWPRSSWLESMCVRMPCSKWVEQEQFNFHAIYSLFLLEMWRMCSQFMAFLFISVVDTFQHFYASMRQCHYPSYDIFSRSTTT